MEINDRPICRNQAEIGDFIGVDKKSIPYFKKKHGLPAFKIDNKGNWKALKSSLTKWLKKMEEECLR